MKKNSIYEDPCHQVVDNRDGTRSLLNRANKKLLVTFRAENQVKKHSIVKACNLHFIT